MGYQYVEMFQFQSRFPPVHAKNVVDRENIKNTLRSCFYIKKYETVCVKVKVKPNGPHVQTLLAKRGCETGSSGFVQMLKQASASNRPMPICVQRIICSVWKKKNSLEFLENLTCRSFFVFIVLIYFYFILCSGSKRCVCFLSSSPSVCEANI